MLCSHSAKGYKPPHWSVQKKKQKASQEDSSTIKSWWWWSPWYRETHKQAAVKRPAKWNYEFWIGIFPACVGCTHAPSFHPKCIHSLSHVCCMCEHTDAEELIWNRNNEKMYLPSLLLLCVKQNNVRWIHLDMRKTLVMACKIATTS